MSKYLKKTYITFSRIPNTELIKFGQPKRVIMKKMALPLHFLLLYLITGCGTGSFRNYSNSEEGESFDTTATPPYVGVKSPIDSMAPPLDCARGIPAPIVKKKVFPKTNFVLGKDKLSSVETVLFDNADKLTITNTGCDYFTLTFRFETSRFNRDSVSQKYWFNAGSMLMKGVLDGLDAPIDLTKGIRKLDDLIQQSTDSRHGRLGFGKEFDYGSEEMRSIVMLEPVQRIPTGAAVVTVSFSVGPL
ncbi:MAG: hypothetical protein J7539_08080 [Niabella sp.]|nr:hypothetical protein [Niabella sp.]